MYQVGLEKAEEQEIKPPYHLLDHRESKEIPKIHLLLLHWLHKAFDYVDHNKLWKILKEMRIPDYLIYLLRNLYMSQEATVITGDGTTDWFKIRKGARENCIVFTQLI